MGGLGGSHAACLANFIAAGAERTLVPATAGWTVSANAQAELRNLFLSSDWLSAFRGWNNQSPYAANKIAPGGYVAFLEKSPFVESPLAGAECEDTVAIVCGISKGQDDGR